MVKPSNGSVIDLADVPTPALILDRARLIQNCSRAHERCRKLGTRLRPHMKTAKSADVARLAVDPNFGGIAVSTLREAEYFAAEGFGDIQLAVCVPPDQIGRAASVAAATARFSLFVDNVESADAVARAAAGGPPMHVWIEIDSGEHRTGVDPDSELMMTIARRLARAPNVSIEGIATHAGQTYEAGSAQEIASIADAERSIAVQAAARLAEAGIGRGGVSVGSSPALFHAPSGGGLSEFRAGVFMLGDLFQAGIGSLAIDDLAASVLTQVISRMPDGRKIILNAGGLALSKDRSTSGPYQTDYGYGLIADIGGSPTGLTVCDTAQEHGFVEVDDPTGSPAVGTRLRVYPNHICMTAAMYDHFVVIEGTQVVAHWPRVHGW